MGRGYFVGTVPFSLFDKEYRDCPFSREKGSCPHFSYPRFLNKRRIEYVG